MKQTIVITGSTRGIGLAMSKNFAKRGCQVVINGTNEELLNEVVKEFKSKDYDAIGISGDVSSSITHTKIIELAVQTFGKIDIWINNAGIPQSNRKLIDIDDSEIRKLIGVNITGLILGTKSSVNYMTDQGYGKVFNMEGFGSDGRILDKLTLYGSSKRAVNYFSKSIAKEISGSAVHVGILSPGMVKTEFLNSGFETDSEEELKKFKKVYKILAEDADIVAEFLVKKILVSNKNYDRINFLTAKKLIPKIIRLMLN